MSSFAITVTQIISISKMIKQVYIENKTAFLNLTIKSNPANPEVSFGFSGIRGP